MMLLKSWPVCCHNFRFSVKKMGINRGTSTVKMAEMCLHSVIFAGLKIAE